MSYTVLARKYRPQKFSDVIGQDHVVRTLKNALEQKRIAHGYIFSGHRGIGKTTIARILAMALNCRSSASPVAEPCGVCDSCREIREGSVGAMDVIEIDAATNRGIEEVRGLIATATAEPARDRYRIFILDEAHQVTDAAFNALLKTLEEPPPWVVFMMATTQPEDIPQTIRSRCQHFSFHAVRFDEIVSHLREISQAEGLTVDEDALALLAEAGDGSMRDALSIMDQAISCCGAGLTAEVVRGLVGNVSTEVLERVMKAVHGNSSDEVLRIVDKLMVEGQSATQFTRQTVRFLRNALVAKVAGSESSILQVSADERRRIDGVAAQFGEEELTRFLQIMLRTHNDVSYRQEQRFHLELGLLKMVHAQRLLPLEQLLSSVSLTRAESAAEQPARPSAQAGQRGATPPPALTPRPPGVPPMGGGASPFGSPAAGGASSKPTSHSAPQPATSQPAPRPSPFEADKARKNREEMSGGAPQPFGARPPAMAPTAAGSMPFDAPFDNGSALAVAPRAEVANVAANVAANPEAATGAELGVAGLDVDAIRQAVLQAMETGGSQMLVHALEEGSWSGAGNLVSVQVEMSDAMIGVSYTREQERLSGQAASRVAGSTVKVRLLGGGTAQAKARPTSAERVGTGDSSGGANTKASIKTRAAEEPVVQRMMEKFGAEIRMVMDRSER